MLLYEQIEKLTKELIDEIEPDHQRVLLLKVLMINLRQQEKNQLEVLKFEFIKDHRQLIEGSPGPHYMNGPQGLGRRMLECDAATERAENGSVDSQVR